MTLQPEQFPDATSDNYAKRRNGEYGWRNAVDDGMLRERTWPDAIGTPMQPNRHTVLPPSPHEQKRQGTFQCQGPGPAGLGCTSHISHTPAEGRVDPPRGGSRAMQVGDKHVCRYCADTLAGKPNAGDSMHGVKGEIDESMNRMGFRGEQFS